MKLLASLFLSACLVLLTYAKPPANCKCWDGYEAVNGPDGPECSGLYLFHTMPCNEPQPPQCKCSGNVTGILKDETGIWCSRYSDGKELKRWQCENKKEWETFYEQNPDYRP